MKIYRTLEKLLLNIINFFWDQFIKIHEFNNIRKKKNIYKKVVLTKLQKKQIDDFYKNNYGKKISYKWHRLYTSYTGLFDYKYVPEYIFSTKIEKIGNRRLNVLPFENKNLLVSMFSGVSKYILVPETIIMRINKNFFDGNCNPIDLKNAVEIINKKYNRFIIKISSDSNSGVGVKIVDINKECIDIEKLLLNYGTDFVVQKLVQQNDAVNQIYPKSINTLRVMTYVTKNGYYVAPIVMRIGKGNSVIDNAHAGGIFIGVDNDGTLKNEAFTEYQERFKKHPDTGFVFENYKLPNIDLLRTEIVKLHKKIPMINFVSWDIAINSDDKFSLIEVNLHSQAIWISQMAHGKSFFEDNTSEFLKELRR